MRLANGFRVTMLALGLAATGAAQEEVIKRVDRMGEQVKMLTSGQIDAWVLQAKAGETILARVSSEAFDPVLEFVDDKEFKLRDVDDPGSQSRFAVEAPRDATYRVRVRAFKDSGGGRYVLGLDRFLAAPLVLDQPATGTVGSDGRGHHRFEAQAGDLLAVRLTSTTVSRSEILDSKGRALPGSSGLARVEQTGTHYVRVTGHSGNAYGIAVRKARVRELAGEAAQKGEVDGGSAEAWSFGGEPGDVVVVDLRRSGPLSLSLAHVPDPKAEAEGVIPLASALDELRILAHYEKGSRTVIAALLGRKGIYQALAQGTRGATVPYEIRVLRTFSKIGPGQELKGDLPIGEFALVQLQVIAGQVATVDLTTDRFDSTLALYNAGGELLQENDDRGLELSSRIAHLGRENATRLLLLSSRGQGGGGAYSLTVRPQAVKEIKRGARNEGTLEPGGVEIWQLRAAKGEMLILSAVSKSFDTFLQVFDSRGVEVARDDNGGTETNSLVSVRAQEEGLVSVWVTSKAGHGAYGLRLLEGE